MDCFEEMANRQYVCSSRVFMTLDLSHLVSLALVFLYLYKHALHGNQLSVVGASVFLDLNKVHHTIPYHTIPFIVT